MSTSTQVTSLLDQKIAEYMAMPFTRMLVPDPEEGGYIAEVLELPGCITEGDTPAEALANLEDAMAGYIAVELERGEIVPEPIGLKEFSGRFPLRMSTELHRQAAMRALDEGVSLNQWIGQAIAARLGAESLADEIVAKLRGELMTSRQTITMTVERTELRTNPAEAAVELDPSQWFKRIERSAPSA